MNAKTLKKLRRSIREVAAKQAGAIPLRAYLPFVPRMVTVPNPALNADGTEQAPLKVHAGFMPIRNAPVSLRGIYRTLKRTYA